MTDTISMAIIAEDNRLEKAAERSRLELARHRWHWTLDASNARRVAISAYARQVNRAPQTIKDMVQGFEDWRQARATEHEFADFQARAKLRGETVQATEAVARARGISIEAARRHRAQDVKETHATAQARALRRNTRVEDELGDVARTRAKLTESSQNRRRDKAQAHSLRYINMEGKIAVAMQNLRSVLDEAQNVEFTDEERALLADSLKQLHALVNLLDVKLTGSTNVDWDSEMAKLTGDVA